MNDLTMIIVVVLHAAIGGFLVTDAYFDFRVSYCIRKFFSK